MNKEKEPLFESGFSEKQIDIAFDQSRNDDQVKAGNIYVPQKKKKKDQK